MFRTKLIPFFMLLVTVRAYAQEPEPNDFTLYTTANGLSHNYTTAITQDSTGYIWITTAAGLNRFNGQQFVPFHSSNDDRSLPAEELTGMSWLDKHQLAIFSSGLHIVNTRNGNTGNVFIPYHTRKYQFKFNMMRDARSDAGGNLYVLTRSGFYHFDRNRQLVYRFDYYKENEVPVTHFYFGTKFLDLDERRLLVLSIGGIYLYDKKERRLKLLTKEDCPVLETFLDYPRVNYLFFQHQSGALFIMKPESNTLYYVDLKRNLIKASPGPVNPTKAEIAWRSEMLQFNDSVFYITGHNSGIHKLVLDTHSGAVRFAPQKYFNAFLCLGMLKDRDGYLWIATNKGVFRENAHRPAVQLAYVPPQIENAFANFRIADLYVSSSEIFVATHEAGLLVFDKLTMRFKQQVLSKTETDQNYIRAIVPVDETTLLLGTHGNLLLFDTKSRKVQMLQPPGWVKGHWTSDLYKDTKGDIWVGSHNIYRYAPAQKSFTLIPTLDQLLDVPNIFAEDRNGHIWMGSHGLGRYHTGLNRYDQYIDSFPFIKMPDKQIPAMVVDSRNTLWFNSNNNGLIAYDIDKKTFRLFSRKDGLPDDNISSLIAVGFYVWIAGFSGIACIDTRNAQIVSFGKEDGFPEIPIGRGSKFFYDEATQQLYLGFMDAVVRFQPDSLLRKKNPPRIFIESLVVGGTKNYFLPENGITTSWKDDELRITIGSIDFSPALAQRYAYRLVKENATPWTLMGNQPSFSISNLSPGNHRIQVRAYSPNNRWPEQVNEITIDVLPPPWKKDWFIAVSALLIGISVYLVILWMTHAIRKKEMEKTKVEKLKADHYKNQYELEQITSYFSSSLAGKKTEEEVLWDVATNLIGRMNYEDCIIYLWNAGKTRMVQKAAHGPKGKPEVITSNIFEVEPGQGIVGQVIQTRQPVLVKDTRLDNRYRVDDEFRLSEVAVPIIHNDELLGVIDSENSEPDYFSERDIKILTTIATLLGNKLKQLQSERTLEAKQIELAGINEQLAEARLSALQAQMNPHFVFNALNSIKRMILERDNEKASRYLSKFALMIRMTLEHSKEIFVTLDENIEYLQAYLDMEKLRFDDSFQYTIEIDEQADPSEIAIPSMMIQPLVENAIWHGLMQSEVPKHLRIAFFQEKNKVICTVEDNGIGIRQAEDLQQKQRPLHRSVGLENLRKRIRIMNEKYDTACSLRITDLRDQDKARQGTKAVLEFNLISTTLNI